ncbi:MAG: hypothetical protein VW395_02440 [Methylotenera sp.]
MRITLLMIHLFFAASAQAACLSDSALQQVAQNELNYMLGRIPPAFADAVADKSVILKALPAEADVCAAKIEMTVPEQDIKTANELLEKDPAKKIILFSQGYTLPESTQLSAVFKLNEKTLEVTHAETLHSAELGKLRASVEMMYAMITQARADIDPNARNNQAWSKEFTQQHVAECNKAYSNSTSGAAGCECQVAKLAEVVSEKQMRYVDYIKSNPYALGTGSGNNFAELKRNVDAGCGLRK